MKGNNSSSRSSPKDLIRIDPFCVSVFVSFSEMSTTEEEPFSWGAVVFSGSTTADVITPSSRILDLASPIKLDSSDSDELIVGNEEVLNDVVIKVQNNQY